MKSFGRMAIGLAATALILIGLAFAFNPQSRKAVEEQKGESQVGQLKADASHSKDKPEQNNVHVAE